MNRPRRERARERARLRQRQAAIFLDLAKLDLYSAEEEEEEEEFFDAREPCRSAPLPNLQPTAKHDSSGRAWKKGDRVRITVAGPHQYRTARLYETRGDWFWWMILDPLPGERTTIRIYKKVTSFQRWSK